MKEQLPCIFLNRETNTCFVYEVRPMPCRTYLNYCSPNVCAESYMPDEPFSYEFLYEFYIYKLQFCFTWHCSLFLSPCQLVR
ncbi:MULTISPECIES: YkgJ family cysteine cluster protein [Anoxybacillus]|nr:YkgJ family cysteine cluster protein [Anoxybacillus flavithermus]